MLFEMRFKGKIGYREMRYNPYNQDNVTLQERLYNSMKGKLVKAIPQSSLREGEVYDDAIRRLMKVTAVNSNNVMPTVVHGPFSSDI